MNTKQRANTIWQFQTLGVECAGSIKELLAEVKRRKEISSRLSIFRLVWRITTHTEMSVFLVVKCAFFSLVMGVGFTFATSPPPRMSICILRRCWCRSCKADRARVHVCWWSQKVRVVKLTCPFSSQGMLGWTRTRSLWRSLRRSMMLLSLWRKKTTSCWYSFRRFKLLAHLQEGKTVQWWAWESFTTGMDHWAHPPNVRFYVI